MTSRWIRTGAPSTWSGTTSSAEAARRRRGLTTARFCIGGVIATPVSGVAAAEGSAGLLVEAGQKPVEDLLAGDLSLGRRVISLPFERGPELDGRDEERAGLTDRLEMA